MNWWEHLLIWTPADELFVRNGCSLRADRLVAQTAGRKATRAHCRLEVEHNNYRDYDQNLLH